MYIGIALFGLLVGALTGFVGAGGGIIAVPALVYVVGIPLSTAISTSLVMGAITPIAALVPRIRSAGVDWSVMLVLAAAGIPASFLGTFTGRLLPNHVVLLTFAALMILAGVQMLRPRPASPAVTRRPTRWALRALLVGLVVGFLTGLLGVGGGFITVPALVLFVRLPIGRAIGTSLAVAMVNSVAAILAHLGTTRPDWGVAAAFGVAAAVASYFTARLAARVSGSVLQRSFAVLVLVVACLTAWQAVAAVR